jgi:hypothetical protein
MRSVEAVVTHQVDLQQFVINLMAKVKEHDENKDTPDWQKTLNCVVFVINSNDYAQVVNLPQTSKPQENKNKDLEHLRTELKNWAGVDLDNLLYGLCTNPKDSLNYSEVVAQLPGLLAEFKT